MTIKIEIFSTEFPTHQHTAPFQNLPTVTVKCLMHSTFQWYCETDRQTHLTLLSVVMLLLVIRQTKFLLAGK